MLRHFRRAVQRLSDLVAQRGRAATKGDKRMELSHIERKERRDDGPNTRFECLVFFEVFAFFAAIKKWLPEFVAGRQEIARL